jgi:peptidoglycan hydrolase FlgJ
VRASLRQRKPPVSLIDQSADAFHPAEYPLAINPPSDIVLDVARAADPLKLQAAALKLTGAVDGDGAGFSDVVDGIDSSARPGLGLSSLPVDAAPLTEFAAKGPQLDRSAAMSGPAMKPYRDFEAFVLQSFIQSMLPTNAEAVFGKGTAGEMWKGLLADELGKQLSRSGGIGIAGAVFKAHPGAAKVTALTGPNLGAPTAADARVAALTPLDIHPATNSGTNERTP